MSRVTLALGVLALVAACAGDAADETPPLAAACTGWADSQTDVDEDGFPPCRSGDQPADCDDLAQDVFPGAPELCNGFDDDCDGFIDDEDPDAGTETRGVYYPDIDQDGEGDANHAGLYLCTQPEGWLTEHTDCDDQNPEVNSAATEACDDIDTDCDGLINDYTDTDKDGYTPCDGDCDNKDEAIAPGVRDLCDQIDSDCDSRIDEDAVALPWYLDEDGDGYGAAGSEAEYACAPIEGRVGNEADCNDGEKSISPDAVEACEGTDQDCDGVIDNGFDKDGDGYTSCDSPQNALDCNDAKADVFPGAPEACDEADQDCDGTMDEDTALLTFYADADGDGYHDPDPAASTEACKLPAAGFMDPEAGAQTDCDDGNSQINPEGKEDCDGVDNDCDAVIDNGFDGDGDGFTRCDSPGNPEDCDDSDLAVYPTAEELCDEVDQDCDAAIDEDVVVPPTWFLDRDGDGAYNAGTSVAACPRPEGYIAATGQPDCDDDNPQIRPDATELCDGVDNNCNGAADEGFPLFTYAADDDKDGALSSVDTVTTCQTTAPEGYFPLNPGPEADCNDGEASVYPGAPERCDGLDNDCDCDDISQPCDLSFIDEGFDADGDGFTRCDTAQNPADCDDSLTSVNPSATEICDGRDQDCDGLTDEGLDADGDGIPNCLDVEGCNGGDDDGDGNVDEGFDADGDGFTRCDTAQNPADCNDQSAAIYPGASTNPDNCLDDDCDGRVDEGTTTATCRKPAPQSTNRHTRSHNPGDE